METELIAELETKDKVKEKKVSKKVAAPRERKVKMEIELPFSGEVYEDRCKGLRTAGKLYTQCLFNVDDGKRYCNKCEKESLKNVNGKPNVGVIEDRMGKGLYEYKDKDGKCPRAYHKEMKKQKWSREYVLEVASKHNIFVSEEHFEEKNKKGCKKECVEKRGKGRPKKMEKEVIVEVIVEEVEVEKVEEKVEEIEIDTSEIEIEYEEVTEIEEDGKKYLRSKVTGLMYSHDEEQKLVGKWNDIEDRIDFEYIKDIAKEESDDEE